MVPLASMDQLAIDASMKQRTGMDLPLPGVEKSLVGKTVQSVELVPHAKCAATPHATHLAPGAEVNVGKMVKSVELGPHATTAATPHAMLKVPNVVAIVG
jgi:hypothetical protein